jgi:sugar phosphate isomerase/epimerase
MNNAISIVDFSYAWVMRELFQFPRSKPGYMTREEVVEAYGKLGVEAIELIHNYWADCTPAYVKSVTADAGLAISAYVIFVDFANPSAAERRAQVDLGNSLLERTVEIGTPLAMIVPAVYKPELSLADQTNWMIEGIRACAERAESIGITMVAENIDYLPMRPFMGRGVQCRDVCAAVDSPAFRLIYDAGCALCLEEDSIETLREMAPYIRHVHLKNGRLLAPGEQAERYNDSVNGRRFVATALNDGLVDTRPVLAELDRIGYDGCLLIEYQGEDPTTAVPRSVEYLRSLQGQVAAAH